MGHSTFSIQRFCRQHDLDHRIRRNTITKIERIGNKIRITYGQDGESQRAIELHLRDSNSFYAALTAHSAH